MRNFLKPALVSAPRSRTALSRHQSSDAVANRKTDQDTYDQRGHARQYTKTAAAVKKIGYVLSLLVVRQLVSKSNSKREPPATIDFDLTDTDTPACRAPCSGGAVSTLTAEVSTTPLPAALPLFASGLGALGLIARRRKRKAALAA